MSQPLIDNLPLIAAAPDGIKALRGLILDLAVRGKLVPQDPQDEPASELLKRIAAEKARLEKQGEIKKQAQLSDIGDDAPFRVQSGWTWTRLGAITSYIQRGKSPKYALDDGLPVVSQKCVQWRGLELSYAKMIVPESLAGYEPIRFLQDGDLLWNSTGTGTIGRVIRVKTPPDNLVCDSHVTVVRCLLVDSDYTRIWLASTYVYAQIEDRASGTTNQIELTAQMALNQPVPLPPLAEQRRIVAKVDELMALCDRLEAQQADAEAVHATLVKTLLDTLTQSQNADDFAANWHRLSQHFPTIFTTEASVDALKQTVLQLAVMGKLVRQDLNDEPIQELLRKVADENRNILFRKQIRDKKQSDPLGNIDGCANIPGTWAHVYLQDIAYQITDGTHLTPKYTESGKPFLSAQNVKPFRFIPDKYRFVSESDFNNYRSNRRPERGDILMTRVGAGIGEAAVLDSDFEFAFYVSLCLIKVPNNLIRPEYIVLWLNSPEGRNMSATRTYGKATSQGNLNLGLIRTFKIPLPPFAEQRRIVAKVDELLALCDTLKAQVAESRKVQRLLAVALIDQTLAA